MRSFWERIDATVKELWLGILAWGVLCALVLVWFVKDRIGCGVGLAIGCLLAAAGVYHMWRTIDRALDLGEGAQKYMTVRSWLRYGVFVLVFGVLMVIEWANPLTAFLGLMGMKTAAYLQPAVHRLLEKRR